MSNAPSTSSDLEIQRLHERIEQLEAVAAAGREAQRRLDFLTARRQSHLDNTPLAAIFWDTEFRVLEWNPAAERIFGYTASEALGANVLDLVVHGDARSHVEEVVRQLLQQTGGSRSTNDNITKDGQRIACEWYNTPVVDDQGSVIGAFSLALDITEQRETAHALSQSEGMLRSIVEHAPVFVMRINRAGCISYINRVAGNYSIEQVLGAPFHSFADPEYRQVLQGAIQRVFDTGATEEYEVLDMVNRRWHQVALAPIVEDDGVHFAVAICLDIHDRREQDQALIASEERLRMVTSQIPAVLWTTDTGLRFTSSIGAGLDVMGLAQNQVVGLTLQDFFQTDDRQFEPLAASYRALAGESVNYEHHFGERWYRVHVESLRGAGNQIIGTIGIALDITEQKLAGLEREKSQRTFEILAENVPGVVYMCNNDQRYSMLYLSNEVEKLLGIPADAFYNDEVSFVELYHPEEASSIPSLVDAAVAQQTPFHLRYRLRHADGHWIWVEEHGQGVYSEDGELRYLVGGVFDITTKRKAEEALLRSKQELEDLVGVRTQELRTANRLLREDYKRQLALTQEIRESEEKFRNMCEDNPGPVSITRASDGEIIYANEPLAELAGVPRDELIGHSAREFYPDPGDRDRLIEELITKGQIRDREMHLRRADGSMIWVSISLRRTLLDGEDVVLAILLDITERKLFNEKLQSQMRMLRRLLYVHDRERQLIAYEIHDGIVQYMTGINLFLQAAESKVANDPHGAREDLQTSTKLLSETIEEARRLIDGLRPGVLEAQGVVPAVKSLCGQTTQLHNIITQCITDVRFQRLAPAVEMAIYRIVQEGLNNIVKHSQTKRARVVLSQREDQLIIKIEDWGAGFDPENVETKRYGLVGIRDRARLLGGKAKIHTEVGVGTRLRVKLPLEDVLLPQDWQQPEAQWSSGEDSSSDWQSDSDSRIS